MGVGTSPHEETEQGLERQSETILELTAHEAEEKATVLIKTMDRDSTETTISTNQDEIDGEPKNNLKKSILEKKGIGTGTPDNEMRMKSPDAARNKNVTVVSFQQGEPQAKQEDSQPPVVNGNVGMEPPNDARNNENIAAVPSQNGQRQMKEENQPQPQRDTEISDPLPNLSGNAPLAMTELSRVTPGQQRQVMLQPGAVSVNGINGDDYVEPEESEAFLQDDSSVLVVTANLVEEEHDPSLATVDPDRLRQEAEAQAREDLLNNMVQGEAVVIDGNDDDKKKKKITRRRMRWLISILVLVLMVVVGVVVAIITRRNNNNASSAEEAIDTSEYLLEVLSSHVDIEPIIQQEETPTPQQLAYEWLLEQHEEDYLRTEQEEMLVERYAIAVLYYSTQGSQWNDQLDFLQNASSVCEWPPPVDEFVVDERRTGIGCDGAGRVNRIMLEALNLNGTLPEELGAVSVLQQLSLSSNPDIYGSLPQSMGNLQFLEDIEMLGTSLTGTVPESMSSLQRLETIVIPSQGLSGTLPSGLLKIESLRIVFLEDNDLEGSIPDVSSQGSLIELHLGGNRLNGTIPNNIYSLSRLEVLSLEENMVTGTISDRIGNLKELEAMHIFDNQLRGSIPAEIAQLTSLRSFWVHTNQMTGTIPTEIGELGVFNALTSMVLYLNPFHGTLPTEMGLISSLRYFNSYATGISGNFDPIFCNSSFLGVEVFANCGGSSPRIECSCCVGCLNDENGDLGIVPEKVCKIHSDLILAPDKSVYWINENAPLDPSPSGSCECNELNNTRCLENDNGDPILCEESVMSCTDAAECEVCNEDGSICGYRTNVTRSYDAITEWIFESWGFQYTKGRNENILFDQDIRRERSYSFYVDGKKCNSAIFDQCGINLNGLVVDCSNIEDGAVYSQCDGFVEDAGFLHYLSPSMWRTKSSCDP